MSRISECVCPTQGKETACAVDPVADVVAIVVIVESCCCCYAVWSDMRCAEARSISLKEKKERKRRGERDEQGEKEGKSDE